VAAELFSDNGKTNSTSLSSNKPCTFTWRRLFETTGWKDVLSSWEAALDLYIAKSCEYVRQFKQDVSSSSRKVWISWAKKRGSSVRDRRSQAILVKLLRDADEEMEQLYTLQGYLDAYVVGCFGHAIERLSEVVSRLSAIFGIGWFFEWPSGRHPLNSTWPWADVKPSLIVLWGVCWMFFPMNYASPEILQRIPQWLGRDPNNDIRLLQPQREWLPRIFLRTLLLALDSKYPFSNFTKSAFKLQGLRMRQDSSFISCKDLKYTRLFRRSRPVTESWSQSGLAERGLLRILYNNNTTQHNMA
jgi:hypothetical protein